MSTLLKEVRNQVCGAVGCNNPSEVPLIIPLGFKARFCKSCAEALQRDLGLEVSAS